MVSLKDNGDNKRTMGNNKTTTKDNGILFYFIFQKLQVRRGHHENTNAWGGHYITLGACWRTLTNAEKMLGVSSKIQKMLKDIKNISYICFWVRKGHQKDTMGWKWQWETLEKCQKVLNNVKKTLKDINKKLIFIFPSDGGMSNATKMISTMSNKN